LFGELTDDGYLVTDGLKASGQYVPGVSRVYLKASPTQVASSVGRMTIGRLQVDYVQTLALEIGLAGLVDGQPVEISGTQPTLGGVLLAYAVESAGAAASRAFSSSGRVRTDASVGTGRRDASVGTGRTDASVGTGRTDASVGTGRTDASVGTGRTDASVGTGRTDASVGTG
jgi:hypothetical protein